jgi:NADH-quinone oxidoreductase subunit C
MDATTIVASLQEALPAVPFTTAPSVDVHPTIIAPREHLSEIARVLRDRADLRFDVLAELTAVDYRPREPYFELVYILLSVERRQRVRLKVRVPGEDPQAATVSDLWPAANWLEREVWDMFGITFNGHPDLRRLLMPEDWEGFPLRKDYPVQIVMKPRTQEPLQVTPSEFRATIEHDRAARHEP